MITSVSPSIGTATSSPKLDKNQQALQQACKQFEGYFLDMMFKEMRKTIPQSGLTGDQSNEQQIFTGMMDQTLADQMSQRGGLGIAQMLYQQLSPELGGSPAASAPLADKKIDR